MKLKAQTEVQLNEAPSVIHRQDLECSSSAVSGSEKQQKKRMFHILYLQYNETLKLKVHLTHILKVIEDGHKPLLTSA